jgi:hypothetical protein
MTDQDFQIEYHGSIVLVRPLQQEARMHLQEHTPGAQWFGGALVVEPRYVVELVERLMGEGFRVANGR